MDEGGWLGMDMRAIQWNHAWVDGRSMRFLGRRMTSAYPSTSPALNFEIGGMPPVVANGPGENVAEPLDFPQIFGPGIV